MLKRELNGVQRGLPWAKVGAVVTGSLYAGLLTTKLGKRIEREHRQHYSAVDGTGQTD